MDRRVNITRPVAGSKRALAHKSGGMSPGCLSPLRLQARVEPLMARQNARLTQVRQQCFERAGALHRLARGIPVHTGLKPVSRA